LTSTIWRCSATLLGGERRQQHHAGVVDEFVLDAPGGGQERVAVGDVGLDGDRGVAELVGQRLDAVARRASKATR
jgi:hypothetical protein